MLVSSTTLFEAATVGGYALGAFNVYNLEGVQAVIAAAEAAHSPAMLQMHPPALKHGGTALIALCLAAARASTAPIAVHLDHASTPDTIRAALDAGITSIMADGSHLPYHENIAFTRAMTALAHSYGAVVEAELGRLSGAEDGLPAPEYEARLTDPDQAAMFVRETGVDALAVCIGNVHGRYPSEPVLDFARLAAIHQSVPIPLVLHGASGVPVAMIHQAIMHNVRKFNVNTEVREAYLGALAAQFARSQPPELVDLMQSVVSAMQAVVAEKIHVFGSDQHKV